MNLCANSFYSAFHVNAELISSLSSVKHKLDRLPYASIISEGSKLGYKINGLAGDALIEFESKSILYRYYFDIPNIAIYSKNLLTLLSILHMLGEDYNVKLDAFYHYITYALVKRQERSYIGENEEAFKERISAVNSANHNLAIALVKANDEKKRLEYANRQCRLFISYVIDFINKEGNTEIANIFNSKASEFNIWNLVGK